MPNYPSFKGYVIVACGTLQLELKRLNENGFLDADKILFTAPGLHEVPRELEKQLTRQLKNAKKYSQKTIVVYGSGCYINVADPFKDIDKLIQEQGEGIVRVEAKNCIDMLADSQTRQGISKGEKIYWLLPGWLKFRKQIFKDWDIGKANETFPQNDKAILLDSIDFFDEYSNNFPEKVLEFSSWMKIPIEPYKISLDRLKGLLSDCVKKLETELEKSKGKLYENRS